MSPKEAQMVIGTQADDDYILRPKAHADLYRETAPALSTMLEDAGLAAEADSYDRYNADAVAARNIYITRMSHVNTAVLITAICGALSMAVVVLTSHFSWIPSWLGRALAGLTVLATALGAYGLYVLREGRLLETWMETRAAAETQRIGYFAALGERAEASADSDLVQLILEYIRRYQFELQRAFYTMRSKQHAATADSTVKLGALGAFIAALSGLASVMNSGPWAALGALTVAGAALGAFSVGREQMNQDRRNAERYRRTADALSAIAKTLTPVREAAATGNGAAVAEFTTAVNEQVSLEHRQWLDGSEGAKAALRRLEQALGEGNNQHAGN